MSRVQWGDLDLALAFGQQPIAHPVFGREVASAPAVGIVFAQHAFRQVATVAPASPAAQVKAAAVNLHLSITLQGGDCAVCQERSALERRSGRAEYQ